MALCRVLRHNEFQSTLPARGATFAQIYVCAPRMVFQSTLPARGATEQENEVIRQRKFQSTLPARGATVEDTTVLDVIAISIHAPRTGSDAKHAKTTRNANISIHAPRTGSDICKWCNRARNVYFNPRSPHGERRSYPPDTDNQRWQISIHAPRTGSDNFESVLFVQMYISIHAPRTGSDRALPLKGENHGYFNPRSPHGERPKPSARSSRPRTFQSTLPARGATSYEFQFLAGLYISIHAPRTGSDLDE